MSRTMTVDFYRVEMPAGSPPFESIVAQILAIPEDSEERAHGEGDKCVRLHWGRKTATQYQGNIVRLRLDDDPSKASVKGKLEEIPFDDGEGVGEQTAFIYDVPTQVLLLQRNRHAVSASMFARYFERLAGLSGVLILDPILNMEARNRYARMTQFRSFEVAVAGAHLKAFEDSQLSVKEMTKICEDFGAPLVRISVSMGHSRGSLKKAPVRSLMKRLMGVATQDDAAVQKIVIHGSADEEVSEAVNLIQDRMVERVEIDPKEPRRISLKARLGGLGDAWERRRLELQRMHPPRAAQVGA